MCQRPPSLGQRIPKETESRAKSIAKSELRASSQQELGVAYRVASEPHTESSARARLPPTVLHVQATIVHFLLHRPLAIVQHACLFLEASDAARGSWEKLCGCSACSPVPKHFHTALGYANSRGWTSGLTALGASCCPLSCCSEDNPIGQSGGPSSQLVVLGTHQMDNLCCSPERRHISKEVLDQLPSPVGLATVCFKGHVERETAMREGSPERGAGAA